MSESVVSRGEIEEMMWALADIRVDVLEIRRQAERLREYATRRPGARERLEAQD